MSFGHLAIDKELERLVDHLLAHDGVDAHAGKPIPRYAPGYARRAFRARPAHLTHATMRFPLSDAAANGPGRIRTCDLGIKSPLLCQLSYRPRKRRVSARPSYSWPAAPID